MARRNAKGVRLFTRNGYNFADRFPSNCRTIQNLPVRSCFIDGEAIVVDANGLSVFDLESGTANTTTPRLLCAFDLIDNLSQNSRLAVDPL